MPPWSYAFYDFVQYDQFPETQDEFDGIAYKNDYSNNKSYFNRFTDLELEEIAFFYVDFVDEESRVKKSNLEKIAAERANRLYAAEFSFKQKYSLFEKNFDFQAFEVYKNEQIREKKEKKKERVAEATKYCQERVFQRLENIAANLVYLNVRNKMYEHLDKQENKQEKTPYKGWISRKDVKLDTEKAIKIIRSAPASIFSNSKKFVFPGGWRKIPLLNGIKVPRKTYDYVPLEKRRNAAKKKNAK